MRHRRARPRTTRYAARAGLLLALGLGVAVAGPSLLEGTAPDAAGVPAASPAAVPTAGGADRQRGAGDGDGVADLRAAADRLRHLATDPLLLAMALPPTELEAREPHRLYTLVTREQPVEPLRYAPPDLVDLPGGLYQARDEVARQTEALMGAADEEGHLIVVTSGFRDHDTQAGTFEDWVRQVGPARADRVSARPGHSEHQLGLAVDVAGTCSYQCFGQTEEGRWVAQNAHRWGFIVRYPEGGEQVTQYAAEPWHLRYVGPRAAWSMHLRGEPYWEDVAPLLLSGR